MITFKQFISESTETTLYHVTKTSTVPKIEQKGITGANPTNFKKASGGRYGKIGEIFAMTNLTDAVRWAAKWDWELNSKFGSGEISIIEFKDDESRWGIDDADPLSQSSNKGKWLKGTKIHVKPDQIKKIIPVTMDLVKTARL